jgi:hypothetical protein
MLLLQPAVAHTLIVPKQCIVEVQTVHERAKVARQGEPLMTTKSRRVNGRGASSYTGAIGNY